jgi:type I restriction enzyme S subunit
MEIKTIKDIAKFIRTGKTPPTQEVKYFDGEVNWYTPGDLDKGKYLSTSKRTLTNLAFEEKKAVVFPKNTLIVGCIGDIGKLGITVDDCSSNQQLTGIYPNDNVDVNYLYYWFKGNKSLIDSYANNAVVPILNNRTLETIKLPIPPLPQQQKIANILDAADALRQNDKALIAKYDELIQSLFLEMFGDPVSNPKGWEKVKMEKLMTILRGGSPRPIDNFLGGTYPWIKIGDATKGDDIYLNSTREFITKDGLKKTRLLPKGSLIFANCGVSLGFARILTFEGCIHDGWLAFSNFNENKLNKIFLLKALNSITQYFRDTAPDGTQPNLNIAIMKNFELIMPPVSLQIKYETTLSLLVAQKAIAQASLAKSEELFNSLLQKAFKGELV